MENALAIAAVAGPIYVVMGLSVLLYSDVWQKMMNGFKKDHLPLLPMMMMYMVLGLIIVRMYNVWEWNLWVLVTLTGWGMLLKGVLFMLLPGSWLKSWIKMVDCKTCLTLAGLVIIVMGAVLSYNVYWV